jgi:hypothetical protein
MECGYGLGLIAALILSVCSIEREALHHVSGSDCAAALHQICGRVVPGRFLETLERLRAAFLFNPRADGGGAGDGGGSDGGGASDGSGGDGSGDGEGNGGGDGGTGDTGAATAGAPGDSGDAGDQGDPGNDDAAAVSNDNNAADPSDPADPNAMANPDDVPTNDPALGLRGPGSASGGGTASPTGGPSGSGGGIAQPPTGTVPSPDVKGGTGTGQKFRTVMIV